MSTPEPIDDSYPDSWKPAHVRERDRREREERTEFELHVSALSDEELQRIRKER